MGDRNQQALYPGRDTPVARKRLQSTPYDPNDDDPLDHTGSIRSNPASEHSQYIVAPSIQVRPEFSSLTRTQDATQPLTCIVVIELPGKRPAGSTPGPVVQDNYGQRSNGHSRQETGNSGHSSPLPPRSLHQQPRQPSPEMYQNNHHSIPQEPPIVEYPGIIMHEEDSPFSAITEDLRNRIIDWKGHPLSDLGPLQMYDLLSVRRDSLVREFYVYLFREALICVVEEKKRSIGRFLSNASGLTDTGSTLSTQSKGVLRLKGRIYVRHIKHVTASSAAGEMSLTIDMEDELASFILIYKERTSLEAWKNTIQALVNMFQSQNSVIPQQMQDQSRQEQGRNLEMEEFGGNAKAMRMLSGSTSTTVSTTDSLLNGTSSRSTMSSSTSHGSLLQQQRSNMHNNKLSPLGEDDELSTYDSPTGLVNPYMSSGPSNSLSPLPHPSIDLILVISVPPPNAAPSTAQLKIRVIKTTLDFILGSMGQRDRLSLVTFEVGVGGKVRKTPFLSVSKAHSKGRLEKFIDGLAFSRNLDDGMLPQDEFLIRTSKDEKTDVVTAVNHGKLYYLVHG